MQLPLAKGDAAFFNPALFHAAGTNRSKDIRRMANLLQVSSAFGRAMESMDRTRMSATLYPALRALQAERQDFRGAGAGMQSAPVPRAIPSRPISTAIRRSGDWRRKASRPSCARRSRRIGRRTCSVDEAASAGLAQADLRRRSYSGSPHAG